MSRSNWYSLDNTAKIFPSMTTKINTNVFRLVCSLKENVDVDILNIALEKTLREFPMFLYQMKDGLFWHYLEKSNIKPIIEIDNKYPCSKIDNGLLFRISYYKKRINLEVYHVLADGNGAMEFLKYLVCTYISKKYKLEYEDIVNDSSVFEKNKDDFQTFDKSTFKFDVKKIKKAYKIKTKKKENFYHDVIEIHTSVKDVKEAAKKRNTKLTIYLTALLIKSIIDSARIKDLKKPIGITLPVDLRNIFPSKTSRNFFYTILVSYQATGNDTIENIIEVVDKQLKEQLDKENLQKKINEFMLLEKILIIKVIPNFIKDFCLKFFAKYSKLNQTTVFSNLGLVKIPKCYEEYIDYIGVVSSTEDLHLVSCSFKDKLELAFSSHYENKEIERNFVKHLKNDIKSKITIVSNIGSDQDE